MKNRKKINPLNNPDAITASFFAFIIDKKPFWLLAKKQ